MIHADENGRALVARDIKGRDFIRHRALTDLQREESGQESASDDTMRRSEKA